MIKNFNADDKLYLLRLRKNIPFPSLIFRRGKKEIFRGRAKIRVCFALFAFRYCDRNT